MAEVPRRSRRHQPSCPDLARCLRWFRSAFHATYAYAQGVTITTATLPAGWEERVVPYDRRAELIDEDVLMERPATFRYPGVLSNECARQLFDAPAERARFEARTISSASLRSVRVQALVADRRRTAAVA